MQVGMATSIPPHNLSEVVDALCALIHNPNASVSLAETRLPLLISPRLVECLRKYFIESKAGAIVDSALIARLDILARQSSLLRGLLKRTPCRAGQEGNLPYTETRVTLG